MSYRREERCDKCGGVTMVETVTDAKRVRMTYDCACTACPRCFGRGWFPHWVEDPSSPDGGYQDGERYCDCDAGIARRDTERDHRE